MKHIRIASFAIIGAVALLSSACVKEITSNEELYRPKGTPIVFSAISSYDNGIDTKAEYSGKLYGTSPVVERIDWKADDPVRIVYNGTAADYTVDKVSGTTDGNSYATLTGSTLYWSGSTPNIFYALYPNRAGAGSLSNTGVVAGTIPAVQDIDNNKILSATEGALSYSKYQPDTEHYGYLVGYSSIDPSSTATSVDLPFRPAVTTFEFRLRRKSSDADRKIRSFTLSSENDCNPLTGGFSFQITGGDQNGATWNKGLTGSNPTSLTGSNGHSITVEFPVAQFPNGVSLPTAGYLDFSVLALPIELSGISLTINYVDNGHKTYNFRDATDGGETGPWHTFAGARKYIITNVNAANGSDWRYYIDEISDIVTYGHLAANLGFGVTSYRVHLVEGVEDPSSIQAVSWKAQYWDGSDWQDWTAQAGDFSMNSYTGNGVSNVSNHESRTVSLIQNSHLGTPAKTQAQILQEATPVTDYDLSKHDIFGNEYPDGKQTTANTYVVSAPGTYLFPCVYGNAITNDQTNYESFAPAGNNSSIKNIYSTYVATPYAQNGAVPLFRYPDVNYVPYFRNAVNVAIQNPYIIDDINSNSAYNVSGENAVVVWQDEQIVNASPTVVTVDGQKYIQFSISAGDIKPGNVVIALRGAPGGNYTDTKTILWSWQIWVTGQDLHPVGGVMPANLGWVKTEFGSQKYLDRSIPIRIVQNVPVDDPNGSVDLEEFTVTQVGDSQNVGENVGSNPYYQWGRKDPMVPGIYSSTSTNLIGEPCTNKTFYPSSDYSGMSTDIQNVTIAMNNVPADYGKAIRNPHVPYVAIGTTTSWIEGYLPGWTYLADGLGGNGAGYAGWRYETAIPYNLWDAYCYGQGSDPNGTHKIKTVYDPCPPGFAVPYKNFSTGLGSHAIASDNSGWYYTQSDGVSQFFPYSGARVYYTVNPNNHSVSITPNLYLVNMAGGSSVSGFYWTDCPLNIVQTNAASWANSTSYSKYYSSYMFVISGGTAATNEFTKGSAASVRPMVYVDPIY